MAWTLSQSGTSSQTVGGGEQTMGSADTNNASFVLVVDLNAMALGDLVELRVKTMTLAAGTTRQAWKGTYQHVQLNPIKISPPIASDQSLTCTINQPAGTARAAVWKLLRI